MRSKAETIEDRSAPVAEKVPPTPWRLHHFSILPEYRLRVRFNDGVRGEVDMKELIFSPQAGIFAALRDVKVFESAFIDGGTIAWPGEIDLPPDAMHDEVQKNGVWVIAA